MEKPKINHELEIAYGTIYGAEEEAALLGVLRSGAPSCGKKVKAFEDDFSAYCGTRYALAVTSATTALTLAGVAVGVGPGTEVITTPPLISSPDANPPSNSALDPSTPVKNSFEGAALSSSTIRATSASANPGFSASLTTMRR